MLRRLALTTTILLAAACGDGSSALVEEAHGLLARATVSDVQARATALARVPGGKVVKAVLEEEDGVLLYSYDIEVTGQEGIDEVHVDAMSGAVLSVTHETEEEAEAEEDAEEAEAGEAGAAEVGTSGSALVEEAPGFLARATITDAVARATALARVPGGEVIKAVLEEEEGVLLYSYDIKVPGQDGIEEVHIDAMTGAVLSVEHESGEEPAEPPLAG